MRHGVLLALVAAACAGPTRVADEPPEGAEVAGSEEVTDAEQAAEQATEAARAAVSHLAAARRLADRAGELEARAYERLEAASDAEAHGDEEAARTLREDGERLAREAGEARLAAIPSLGRIGAAAAHADRVAALSLRASSLEMLGRRAEALADARALVELCADCAEAADAYLRLGEHYFEQGAMEPALAAYARAAAVPTAPPRIRAYALYKIGWARLNLAEPSRAWDAFDEARREALAADGAGAVQAREAQRDQVRALARLPADASEAVSRIRSLTDDPAELARLAARYADALRDEGRDGDAAAFEQAWAHGR